MPASILGSEFRLTGAAHRHILETIDDFLSRPGFETFFAMISWGDPLDTEYIPGPCLGIDNRVDAPQLFPNFYQVGKYKVLITLDEQRIQECRDKILDYRCRRLVLMYRDDVLYLDS
jgi:hypothetical protein